MIAGVEQPTSDPFAPNLVGLFESASCTQDYAEDRLDQSHLVNPDALAEREFNPDAVAGFGVDSTASDAPLVGEGVHWTSQSQSADRSQYRSQYRSQSDSQTGAESSPASQSSWERSPLEPNQGPIVADRVMLHLDIDAFFAQVEQIDDPSLRGLPVIVGGSRALIKASPQTAENHDQAAQPADAIRRPHSSSSSSSSTSASLHLRSSRQPAGSRDRVVGRGVVCTSSYEARAMGVRTAMPLAQALRLCPNAICIPGNYKRYTEVSRAVFAVVQRFSPLMRMASLDEAYVDISGLQRWIIGRLKQDNRWNEEAQQTPWPVLLARELRQAILNQTEVVASVGIGPNSFIAKVASKKSKPNGLLHIPTSSAVRFAQSLRVEEVPGVGPAGMRLANRFGYCTLQDVAAASPSELATQLDGFGAMLWARSQAQGGRQRDAHDPDRTTDRADGRRIIRDTSRRSMSRESTFNLDVSDPSHLVSTLGYLTERLCWSLRREKLHAACISVKIRFADFTTLTCDHTLLPHTDGRKYTDRDDDVLRVALQLLETLFARRLGSASTKQGRASGGGVTHLVIGGMVNNKANPLPQVQSSLAPSLGSPRPHLANHENPLAAADAKGASVGNQESPGVLPEPIRLIGVKLSHLKRQVEHQCQFGEAVEERERIGRVLEAADMIRNRFGFGSVALGRSVNLLKKKQSQQTKFNSQKANNFRR